mmetsp:Transcript_5654/g.10217  ORF Transcript_5654/g.10217 Transcript_5654/m.10217 type:complete len:93 (-) Transcript_5654:160-438(-)
MHFLERMDDVGVIVKEIFATDTSGIARPDHDAHVHEYFNRGCVFARNEDTKKLLPVLIQHVQGSVEYAVNMIGDATYDLPEAKIESYHSAVR